MKFVDLALWIDKRNSILRDPFQENINTEPEPKKYYLGSCPDHNNELSVWVSEALPSTKSTSTLTSTSNLSVQQLSYAEVSTNFPITSQPKHTSRPSGGQATHTCTAQTQSAADTPAYASIAASTTTVVSSNLSPSQQSQSTKKKLLIILQNTSVPMCLISINQ